MKSAKEWFYENNKLEKPLSAIELIKQIQLDAFKAGMNKAVECFSVTVYNTDLDRSIKTIIQSILTERDNLKELP
jgi:hypothetical protein